MTYTESQIEEAARILCEMRGVDPDERIGGVRPKWKYYAGEIRAHIDRESALQQAVERKP